MAQVIRNAHGGILAKIETVGTVQKIYNEVGWYLGQYDSKDNKTRNDVGWIIGEGNLLSTLIKRQ